MSVPLFRRDQLLADLAQAPTQPIVAFVDIDPVTAKELLDRNTRNRGLSPTTVNTYARDMAAGAWKTTGDGIKFAADGTLLDGQHRLAAIVKANVPVGMFVFRNIETDAQDAMDTGRKRSAADALGLAGETHASHLAATTRHVLTYEKGDLSQLGQYAVTTAEIQDCLLRNPDIRSAVAFTKGMARKIDSLPAIVAFAYWRVALIDRTAAAEFFAGAASGVGLADGDPRLALTKRLAEARRNRERLPHEAHVSMIFRAWNAWRANRPLHALRLKSPGPSGGLVPTPIPR